VNDTQKHQSILLESTAHQIKKEIAENIFRIDLNLDKIKDQMFKSLNKIRNTVLFEISKIDKFVENEMKKESSSIIEVREYQKEIKEIKIFTEFYRSLLVNLHFISSDWNPDEFLILMSFLFLVDN
jgi:hypothetical protein